MAAFTVLIISAIIATVSCSPGGPPGAACESLMPGQPHLPSTGTDDPPQYEVTTSSTMYGPGETITETFATTGASNIFRGIIVQARSKSGDTTPVGTFSGAAAGTQTLTCTAADDTWGHADKTDKTSVSVTWTAPMSGDAGDLVFSASVVQQNDDTSIFYTGLMSADVVYNGPTGTPLTTDSSSGSVRASLLFTMVILLTIAITRRFL